MPNSFQEWMKRLTHIDNDLNKIDFSMKMFNDSIIRQSKCNAIHEPSIIDLVMITISTYFC